MKYGILLFPIFLLAACQSPEEAVQAQQERIAEDNATCNSYGLRPGTEAFGNCRLQLDIARQQRYNSYYNDPYPHYYGGISYYHR